MKQKLIRTLFQNKHWENSKSNETTAKKKQLSNEGKLKSPRKTIKFNNHPTTSFQSEKNLRRSEKLKKKNIGKTFFVSLLLNPKRIWNTQKAYIAFYISPTHTHTTSNKNHFIIKLHHQLFFSLHFFRFAQLNNLSINFRVIQCYVHILYIYARGKE